MLLFFLCEMMFKNIRVAKQFVVVKKFRQGHWTAPVCHQDAKTVTLSCFLKTFPWIENMCCLARCDRIASYYISALLGNAFYGHR
jgi:hypothetical protein